MKRLRTAYALLATLAALIAGVTDGRAQSFAVASFRQLPNDVSAFINPVRDLNDDDCALVKIIAPEDFAFSTPLGIVKREDHTGEIWLYLPHGSRKITLKHPQWGVLRDYRFPCRIDSHMTYEMRLDIPLTAVAGGTAQQLPAVTVRDTLVLTRVDTVVVAPVRKRVPLQLLVLATGSYGGKAESFLGGVMFAAVKRHGVFAHIATDFGSTGATGGECDRHGYTADTLPFYSGRTRRSAFMINAGAVHRLPAGFAVFEGAGYSRSMLAWELAPSEGGGYLKNSYYSTSGVSFEAGVLYTRGRIAISASVASIRGTDWFGTVGIGITLGRR